MALTNAQKQAEFRNRRDAQAKAWQQVRNPEAESEFRANLAQSEAEEPGTASALIRFKEAYIQSLSSKEDTATGDPRVLLARAEVQAARDCEGARFVAGPTAWPVRRIELRSGEVIDAPRP